MIQIDVFLARPRQNEAAYLVLTCKAQARWEVVDEAHHPRAHGTTQQQKANVTLAFD